MDSLNEKVYNLLSDQINSLLTPTFLHKLELGKYSRWALDLTSNDIIAMISAIGIYGQSSIECPEIDTKPMFLGKGLNELLGITLWLNKEQQKALHFLGYSYWKHRRYNLISHSDYGKSASSLAKNVKWAMNLTSSDLFGILWHLGGFGVRFNGNTKKSINAYHPRSQECLICLMRVAQSQLTYYQLGGIRYPLREHLSTLNCN